MSTLRNILPYSLHDALKLLGRGDDATGDEFQFGTECISELLHSCGMSIYILDCLSRIWMFPYEIVFSNAGMKQPRKPVRKLCSRLK